MYVYVYMSFICVGMSMNIYTCMHVCMQWMCAYKYCSWKVVYLQCSVSFHLHHSTMLLWLFYSILQRFSL